MEEFRPLVAKVTGIVEFQDGTTTGFEIHPDAEANWMQNGGPDGAALDVYSIGDPVLDRVAEAFADYQRDNTPTHHYHVGYNVETYSPDPDSTTCCFTAEEARAALKAQLERSLDAMPECINPVDAAESDDSLCGHESCIYCTAAAIAVKEEAALDADTSIGEDAQRRCVISGGGSLGLAHWIDYVPAGHCEIDPEG